MIPVLIVAGLASERALAVTPVGQTIDPPSPGLPLSYGDTGGLNIGVQNNTTVHGLSVNASSTWIGQNFYGLSNTAGNTIDTGGFTVNTGSKVYGSSSGIQNASGATISASAGSGAITNFGSIGFIGMTHSEKGLYNNGVISATGPLPGLTNRGEIRGYTAGILNDTNGTIYGGTAGIQNATGATIGAVTLGSAIQNLGTIGSFGGAFSVDGIYNDGTITGSLGATIYNKGGGLPDLAPGFTTMPPGRSATSSMASPPQYETIRAGRSGVLARPMAFTTPEQYQRVATTQS